MDDDASNPKRVVGVHDASGAGAKQRSPQSAPRGDRSGGCGSTARAGFGPRLRARGHAPSASLRVQHLSIHAPHEGRRGGRVVLVRDVQQGEMALDSLQIEWLSAGASPDRDHQVLVRGPRPHHVRLRRVRIGVFRVARHFFHSRSDDHHVGTG